MTEFVDQAGLFRDRNELRGRDHAAFGVAPSQQRLAGGDLAVLEIEHRLIIGLEAAIRYRLTQFEFQDSPRLGAGIHAGLEEAIGPPSVAFGAVQREVRVPQQLVEIEPIAGGERDADAGICRDQVARALERPP